MSLSSASEAQIELAALKLLTAKGYKVFKNFDQANKVNGSYKKNPWQPVGHADLTVWLGQGRLVYLECKSATGKQSPEQQEFERSAKEHGFPYFVFRSPKEALRIVKEINSKLVE